MPLIVSQSSTACNEICQQGKRSIICDFQDSGHPSVFYPCIAPRKIIVPPVCSPPPEYCLRCLLSFFPDFWQPVRTRPLRNGANAPPEPLYFYCGQMRSICLRKNDIADSEFCERRRIFLQTGGTMYFSLGAVYRIRYGRMPAVWKQIIKQLPKSTLQIHRFPCTIEV